MTTTQTQKRQATAPTGASVAGTPTTGGTFPASARYWKITAMTRELGESAASTEVNVTPTASGCATVSWTGLPAGTYAVNIYRGNSAGNEDHLIATLSGAPLSFVDTGTAGAAATPPANTAWGSATKSGAVPTKANMPSGLPVGQGLGMYAGLVGWCLYPNGSTGQLRNQKYVRAAGYDVQEV